MVEAQVFHLLGTRPVWDARGNVTDVEVIARAELGRPRIDIVIASAAEGMFYNVTQLMDKAVQLVKMIEEADNLVRRNYLATRSALIDLGYSEQQAERTIGRRSSSSPGQDQIVARDEHDRIASLLGNGRCPLPTPQPIPATEPSAVPSGPSLLVPGNQQVAIQPDDIRLQRLRIVLGESQLRPAGTAAAIDDASVDLTIAVTVVEPGDDQLVLQPGQARLESATGAVAHWSRIAARRNNDAEQRQCHQEHGGRTHPTARIDSCAARSTDQR